MTSKQDHASFFQQLQSRYELVLTDSHRDTFLDMAEHGLPSVERAADITKSDKKRLKALRRQLHSLNEALADLKSVNPELWSVMFWRSRIKPEDVAPITEGLAEHIEATLKAHGRPGTKSDDGLNTALRRLERAYLEAGGKTTGVGRDQDTGERTCTFIEFSCDVLNHIFVNDEFEFEALVRRWERERTKIRASAHSTYDKHLAEPLE